MSAFHGQRKNLPYGSVLRDRLCLVYALPQRKLRIYLFHGVEGRLKILLATICLMRYTMIFVCFYLLVLMLLSVFPCI